MPSNIELREKEQKKERTKNMRAVVRHNTFETNSSSQHAVAYLNDEQYNAWLSHEILLGFFGPENNEWRLLTTEEEQDLWHNPHKDETGTYLCGWALSGCPSYLLDNSEDDPWYARSTRTDDGMWKVEVVHCP